MLEMPMEVTLQGSLVETGKRVEHRGGLTVSVCRPMIPWFGWWSLRKHTHTGRM